MATATRRDNPHPLYAWRPQPRSIQDYHVYFHDWDIFQCPMFGRAARLVRSISQGKAHPLESLPLELIKTICSFLPLPTGLINLSNTSRSLKVSLGDGNNYIWYKLFNSHLSSSREKYKEYTKAEIYGLAFAAPRGVHEYLYKAAYNKSTSYREFEKDYARAFYNVFMKSEEKEMYAPRVNYRATIIAVLREKYRRTGVCQSCLKIASGWLPEEWQVTVEFYAEVWKIPLLGPVRMTRNRTYCGRCCARELLHDATYNHPSTTYSAPFPDMLRVSYNLHLGTCSQDLRNYALATKWSKKWWQTMRATILRDSSVCRAFTKPLINEQTNMALFHISYISKAIRKKCGLTLEQRRVKINEAISAYKSAFPGLCECIHKTIRRKNAKCCSLVRSGMYDREKVQLFLESEWVKFSGHWRSPSSEDRKTVEDNMAYYRLRPNYHIDWIAGNDFTVDKIAGVKFPAMKNNIFSCLELIDILKPDQWIETASSTIITRFFQDPQLPFTPTAVYRDGLYYVGNVIKNICDAKFTNARHAMVGQCRYCDDGMWLTAYNYTLHLYQHHNDHFHWEHVFMWRNSSSTDSKRRSTRGKAKEVAGEPSKRPTKRGKKSKRIPIQKKPAVTLEEVSKRLMPVECYHAQTDDVSSTKEYGIYKWRGRWYWGDYYMC